MSNGFIADLDGFVYADELVRAVGRVIGGRPKTKTAAKDQLQNLLANEPQNLEQHLRAVLGELLAEDLGRWSKEKLGSRMNKPQAVNALAAWYAGVSSHQSSTIERSRSMLTPVPASAAAGRAVALYCEDKKPTTREDYFKIDLGRTKGDLHVKGPCPSCGAGQEFEDATKRQVGTVAKVIGGLLSQPVKTLSEMFTSAECMEMSCSKCGFGVTICGHCDQINPHTITKCAWCGHNML